MNMQATDRCKNCGAPTVGARPFPFQDASGQWWAKTECPHCMAIVGMTGPYGNQAEVPVNPTFSSMPGAG